MRIGVIGAGAWGTALAQLAATDGDPVTIWAHEREVAAAINASHENLMFLPGVPLSPSLTATTDLSALDASDVLFVAPPAQHMGQILSRLAAGRHALVLCSKGIEASSGRLMSEVAHAVHPDAPLAVLSGPTFAREVAIGQPTAITLATHDAALGAALAQRLARPTFRPYASTDVVGAEIGGAVKNVIAIACGIVEGLNFGENARAALIARGFAEMVRFGIARGGRAETMTGLSGLGDLVLTCSSTQSRNFSFGKALGQGAAPAQLLADSRTVAEGAFTARVLVREARRTGTDMPVAQAVCAIVEEDRSPRHAVAELLARPLRMETA